MKRSTAVFLLGAVLAVVGSILWLRSMQSGPSPQRARQETGAGCTQVQREFAAHRSNDWISFSARVSRLLPDSYGRFEHQRFIVRCTDGQTVLVDNDVSIGQRVPVRVGDSVGVRGQYIWNDRGGLVHFTHHGTPGEGGWILYRGRLYA